MKKNNHRMHGTRLVVTNAIASAMLLVYGRSAYAGTCVETAPASGIWVCSGAAGADSSQFPVGSPVTVTTTPGFGMNTAAGTALIIRGYGGGTTFTDNYASVITGANRGIYARNNVSGDLTITTNGMITGATSIGIDARNFGTGDTTITTTGSVTGLGFGGIYARNDVNANDLTISAVNVTGGSNGIWARNLGTGETTVTTTGTITGTGVAGNNGIIIQNFAAATDATVTAGGNVTGGQDGIWVTNDGSGSTTITSTGYATGVSNHGIYARATGTDITITANNASGGTNGIAARNYGTGETNVTATGTVIGTSTHGIFAINGGASTNLSVNATDVTGGQNGIFVRNYGIGATTITSTGTVNGTAFTGIYASSLATTTGLTITANNVAGGLDGIITHNSGSGATTINTTGTVTGTSNHGIYAHNAANATDLTITANSATGGQFGIFATSYGIGATTITSTGTVTGTNSYGILAHNNTTATDVTINTADVTSDQTAIFALNEGTGATTITSTGAITGTNVSGIFARNTNYATDMTITTVDVTGGQYGIRAFAYGTGANTVTAIGTVTGTATMGIVAQNNVAGTDLTVNAVDVTGGQWGIGASNQGTGSTTITSTGTVTGTTTIGIQAVNFGADLTVNAVDVTGGQSGIYAFNIGTGATTVTATGTVTGTSDYGILATTIGTDITVTAADVAGGEYGISTYNGGTGTTTITSTGTVAGTNIIGILAATSSGLAGNISVSAVDVSGGFVGIQANNNGIGSTTITSTGTVTGNFTHGILAYNFGVATTGLTINAADVNGVVDGIRTLNSGVGATTITTTGVVTGTNNDGINALNNATSTDLTISTSTVTGGIDGIHANNNGTGTTTVTSTGTVTGTTTHGIFAQNALTGTNVNVTAVNVTGGQFGIFANNYGNGTTTVTSTGSVTGTNTMGIVAQNDSAGTNVTVTALNSTGGQFGIVANNRGTGTTTVTSTGTATGGSQAGILAQNDASATSITVNAVNTTGNASGIQVLNQGTGSMTITSTGTASGTTSSGIVAMNGFASTSQTITAVNATGGVSGINSSNAGSGPTTISVTGNIAGGTGAGISVITLIGNMSTVNLSATSTVGATSGNAIFNNNGNSIINVANGALINGTVRLNDGSDTFNVAGGTNLSGITILDGGDDVLLGDGFVDSLNLNTAWTGNLNGANILNWEFININGGTVGFSNAAITAGQINVNNFGTLNGSNNLVVTGSVAVASGSRVIAGNAGGTNAMNVSGNLFNAGTVQLSGPAGQQVAGDTLTVTGNYIGAGGTLVLDTVLGDDTSVTDSLVIAGNASGSTGITVNNVGGLGAMTTGDGIMLVDVAGTSANNAFSLNNDLTIGAFHYNLFQNGLSNPADGDWYLRTATRGIVSPAMVIPDMGNKVGLSMLGSLQERLGERGNDKDDSSAWVRVIGNAGSQTHESNIGNFEGRNDSVVIQAGVDLSQGDAIRWGVFAAKTNSTTHMFDLAIDPNAEAGKASVDGFAAGVYATHYGDHYYWDAVIQHGWLDAKASGDGDSFETNSKNWLASFEFGGTFQFGNSSLEPQAQIIAGKGNTDSASDGVTTYDYSDEEVLVGRLGVRWSHAKDQGKGRFVPYMKLNVLHNFGDDSLVTVGPMDITTERNDTWAELGLGFNVLTRNNWSVFMQYDYEKGLGDSDLDNHSGTIGLRRSW